MSLQVSAGESWLDVLMYAPPKTFAELSKGGRFDLFDDESLPAFAALKRASINLERPLFRIKGDQDTVAMYVDVNEVPDMNMDKVATVELVLHPV